MNRRVSVFVLCSMTAFTGCGSAISTASEPTPTQSAIPSELPTPPSIPSLDASPSTAPTVVPTDSPSASASALGPWQSVRVRVNGLGVRTAPSPASPLIAGYRSNVTSGEIELVTDAVRVDDGHFLWIEDGPLVIDGVPWFRVANTQRQSDGSPDFILWDADGDEFRYDYGWVAGGDGTTSYLVADEPPPPPPEEPVFGPAPPPYVLMAGIGDATSESFPLGSPVGVVWVAADPNGEACDITITLQPPSIDMGSAHIDGWGFGGTQWPQDIQDFDPVASDHWLEIQSDCSWSIRGHPIQG